MIKELYRKMIPIGIRYAVAQKRDKKNNAKSLEKLEKIYADSAYDKRYQNEIEWIVRNKRIEVFPYEWVKEYDDFGTEVFTDKELKMKYVLHNGKRLYFPKGYSAKFIQRYYRSLVVEQDKRSAHHYFSDDEQCIEGSVFVDVGAAEGIISLNVVDKAEKIVMFECNDAWLEALNATFAPWKEKIQIIRKFAGNCDNENMISLDKYFEDESHLQNIVLKLDVEGAEKEVLSGAKTLLEKNVIAAYICTYHNDNDYDLLVKLIEKFPFEIQESGGYMYYGEQAETGFRKGLIRVYRKK